MTRPLALGGLLASVGWVLLVVATGEPPRNLIVQAALLVILAADGWSDAATWLARRVDGDESRAPEVLAGAALLGAAAGGWAGTIVSQTGSRGGTVLAVALAIGGAAVVAGLAYLRPWTGRLGNVRPLPERIAAPAAPPVAAQAAAGGVALGSMSVTPAEWTVQSVDDQESPGAGHVTTSGVESARATQIAGQPAIEGATAGPPLVEGASAGPPLEGASAGPPPANNPPMLGRWLVAATAGLATLAALAVLAAGTVAAFQPNRENAARAAASATIAAWLDANVPANATVAFGSLQAHETAVLLEGRYHLTMLAPEVGTIDPAAPLGLRASGRQRPADWIAMDAHPRLQALYAFRSSHVTTLVQRTQPSVIVYVWGLPTSAPSLVGALLASTGVTPAEHWSWKIPGGSLVVDVLRVDPATFQLPSDRVFAEAEAVRRLAPRLAAAAGGAAAAARIADRLTFWPTSSDDAKAMAALRKAAHRN